jgi:DNA-binding transcriptional regulator GbsR (MarR family)
MKKPLTLNAGQLELLRDFTNFPVLQIFAEPHNPSQVAKGLKMPANSMHYRVKKLYEAGLLKVVEQKGRRRSYQSVATNFRVRRDLMQSLNDSHGFTKDALTKVTTGYETALEEHIEKHAKDSDDTGYIYFGIDDSERIMTSYEPCLGLFETSLSQEQYLKLTKALLDIASETTKQRARGKHCTVAIVAFAKSSAFPNL